MESLKPYAVCIPFPAQGHINPMLKLAKLLHFIGFHITFVHTEFNYQRILSNRGPDSLKGFHDFQFETISDGLPEASQRGIEDLQHLCITLSDHGRLSFRDLIVKLNGSSNLPAVSCIISDGASCLTNGYLDNVIDWIPVMEGIRLKDLPTFIRTTDPNDIFFNYNLKSLNNSMKAKGLILNTFDELDKEVLDVINTAFPVLCTIGPLSMLQQNLSSPNFESIESNLWKEDNECLSWLDKREPKSVVYVNFGSLITVSQEQLKEFAWGFANSKYPFLWVIRPDLLDGGEKIMSKDFMDEINGRGLLVEYLSRSGIDLLAFFADQQTNCLYSCEKWGIGMEIDSDVKREKVEQVVRELMEGKKGKEMRVKAMDWQRKAQVATNLGGSSYSNFERLANDLMI
ncbi:hypothetical protein GH714_007674 [Hevea brasiliensis]|uniref:Glycosyltransferase N-terminal domain-containing protein n=1 Tax=Hevea brasiliensis TaxID=3981 RepID=A0A6A6KYL9_HEVBR|nr:hypothetical protein GH714_007674 [Hevea brasiliensis]